MRIGIGISTTPKRKVDVNDYIKYLDPESEYLIVVSNDKDYLGAPSSKNIQMKTLYEEGCDIIVLFDDDCYPIYRGFDKYLYDQMTRSNTHYITLPNIFKDKLLATQGEVVYWSGGIGCFMAYSRRHIEVVGYFNTNYYKYGFTDPSFNYRSRKSPLSNNKEGYTSLIRIPSYIYSEDLYIKTPTPNYSEEEKSKFIELNRPIFKEEVANADKGIIYHEFKHKDLTKVYLTIHKNYE